MPEVNQRETGAALPPAPQSPVSVDELGPVSPSYEPAPRVVSSTKPPPGIEAAPVATGAPKRRGSAVREIAETLLLAFVIFIAVRALVLNFRVDGNSMVPNLHNGEMLLVNRNAYVHVDLNRWLDYIPGQDHDDSRMLYLFDPPRRGDIVVFTPPTASDKPYIKRVIALEGETVEIREGAVFVNGEKLDEPYIQDGITECHQVRCTPWTVPEGHIFVMGDNRQNSSDSRVFGPVSTDNIIGRASVVYWPLGSFGLVPHADYGD
jgi:signal peptidase I